MKKRILYAGLLSVVLSLAVACGNVTRSDTTDTNPTAQATSEVVATTEVTDLEFPDEPTSEPSEDSTEFIGEPTETGFELELETATTDSNGTESESSEPQTEPETRPAVTQPSIAPEGSQPTEQTAKEPEVTTTEPEVTTTEPEVTTTKPEVTTTEPEVTTTKPEVTTAEPEVTTTEPEVTTTEPEVTTTEPEVTTTKPEVTTTKPEVTTAEPEVTTAAPEKTTAEPEVTTTEPEEATTAPEDTTTEPATEPTYNADEPTVITLSDEGTQISNNNGAVTVDADGNVHITAGGDTVVYTVYGSMTDKSLIVEAPDTDVVNIDLYGVTISSSVSHPIYIASADKVEISAKSGTTSTITDQRVATDPVTATGAAIYSIVDLKLKGQGTLIVESTYNNGVGTKDDLTIKKLTLNVKAPNNAIKGNDSITVESGNVTAISVSGDALKTDNNDVSSTGKQRGIITITSGTVNAYAACDAIDAAYDVVITGGTVNAYTESYSEYSGTVSATSSSTMHLKFSSSSRPRPGSSSSSFSHSSYTYSVKFTLSDGSESWVNPTLKSSSGNTAYYSFSKPANATHYQVFVYASGQTQGQATTYTYASEYAAINTAYDTLAYSSATASSKTISFTWTNYTTQSTGAPGGGMQNGNANANAAAYSCKGIKADNSVTISGGVITVKAHDGAIHANSDVLFADGVTYGVGNVTISGGTLTLYSDDDGLHADNVLTISGGEIDITNSYEGVEGKTINIGGGRTHITSSDDAVNGSGTSATVNITDGVLYFNAGGDGLDSNGNINMSGGTVLAQGPTNGGNGVLDFDGKFSFSGGFLLTVGCSGMNQAPTATSGNMAKTQSISTNTSSYVVVTIDGVERAVLKITKSSQNYCVLAYNNVAYGSSATVSVTTSTSQTLVDNLYYIG